MTVVPARARFEGRHVLVTGSTGMAAMSKVKRFTTLAPARLLTGMPQLEVHCGSPATCHPTRTIEPPQRSRGLFGSPSSMVRIRYLFGSMRAEEPRFAGSSGYTTGLAKLAQGAPLNTPVVLMP